MISISIPGFGDLQLEHLVLDFNGTLAVDGMLISGVVERLASLESRLQLHVATADLHGNAAEETAALPVALVKIDQADEAESKLSFIRSLGTELVVAIGNGRNDRLMLESAAVGIGLIQQEGGAVQTLKRADIVCASILDALDLLLKPKRLAATLRS